MPHYDVLRRQTTRTDGHKREETTETEMFSVSANNSERRRVEELRCLEERLEMAAEVVFQQHLTIRRFHHDSLYPEKRDERIEKGEKKRKNAAAHMALLTRQLQDVEDHLSQEANQYIRASNVTALYYLNEKQYSHALRILLAVEGMLQKGAGKWFSFLHTTECIVQNPNGFVQSIEDPYAKDAECVQEIFVPFFTKRHEKMRQLALAVVENNIGLYHFKIAEYELAGQRMTRALQLEELLSVETIGVTYFNLAQTQYELGCVEEAFSTITLAEEAIEKRIYDGRMQRNNLKRIAQHQSTHTTITTIPGLEKRVLDVYLSWREAVCLLARVLDMHGRWLEENNAYKAAMHRYEQSERWISSVKRQSVEEKLWREELQRRMQTCKRRLRHYHCCVPKPPVGCTTTSGGVFPFSSSSSTHFTAGEPKSIIVTTTLPRRVEIAFGITPSLLEETEEREREGTEIREKVRRGKKKIQPRRVYPYTQETKPRYTDVHNMSNAAPLHRKPSEHSDSLTNDSHVSSHHNHNPNNNNNNNNNNSNNNKQQLRLTPHRPVWDSSTVITRREERRGVSGSRTASTTTATATISSELQSSSHITSACHTPLTRGTTNTERSPSRQRKQNTQNNNNNNSNNNNNNNNINSAVNTHGRTTPVVEPPRQGREGPPPFRRTRTGSYTTTGTSSSSLLSTSATTPTTTTTVLSLARCIHILQAFARARLSCLERDWRETPCGRVYVSSTTSSPSSMVTSSPASEGPQCKNRTLRFTPNSNNSVENCGISITTAPPPAEGGYSDEEEVVLAFFAAHRSALLTFQKQLERKYTQIMKGVSRQENLTSTGTPQKAEKKENKEEQVMRQSADVNGISHLIYDREKKSALEKRENDVQGCCVVEEKPIPCESNNNNNRNTAGVSEERYQRRYNSLLRMAPRIDVETKNHNYNNDNKKNNHVTNTTTTNNNPTTNGHLNGISISVSAQTTTVDPHSNISMTPHISEDSCSRNGVTDDSAPSSRRIKINNDSDRSRPTGNSLQKSTGIPRVIFNRIPNGFAFTDCFNGDCGNRDESYHMKSRLNTRNSIYGQTPSSSSSSLLTNGETTPITARATTELIKQRILREEAATIIQQAWRCWKERRQYEAVRQLIYR